MTRNHSLGILIGGILAMVFLTAAPAFGQEAAGPPKDKPAALCAGQAGKTRVIKKDRIVFLGNSITLHAPLESIGWTGNWGMAASAAEKDYVHLVVQSLSETARPQFRVKNIADFERHYDTYAVEEELRALLDFRPTLVIIAIGENVAPLTSEESKTRFYDCVIDLLKAFQKNGNPTLVVRSCFGQYEDKDAMPERAANEVGAIFVNLGELDKDEANYARSERQIAHAGVAGHPGDRGMKAIADAIIDAIRKAGQRETEPE